MRSFQKLKSSQSAKITLSFTEIGKPGPFLRIFNVANNICVITLFPKLKFSRKFPNLQQVHFAQATYDQLRKNFNSKIFIIFLLINLNMCFGCSEEPSH